MWRALGQGSNNCLTARGSSRSLERGSNKHAVLFGDYGEVKVKKF